MNESNDTTVVHTDDRLEYAHERVEAVSPQVEVCKSQEMMTAHGNPYVPSRELSDHDKYTIDT